MCTVGCSTFVLVYAMENRIQLHAGAHVGRKFCFGCICGCCGIVHKN